MELARLPPTARAIARLGRGDWDVRSSPTFCQSAQPGSPYYGNLLKLWAEDRYFPLLYSRPRVEKDAAQKLALKPR
jgi:hypothetical protein